MINRLHTIIHDGPLTARPLVIAHGLFGSGRNWGAVARRLCAGRKVIAVDMRNHGDSFHSTDHTYPELATDLARVIMEFGGTADVLGHSMGGKACMVLALQYPQLVQRLIVADIAPVVYSHSNLANIAAMKSVDLALVSRRSDADAQLSRSVSDASLRGFFLQSLDITANSARWKLNFVALESNAQNTTGFPEISGHFDGQALFLRGAQSDYILPEHWPIIRALFPAATLQTIENAGHWLHAEQPNAFVNAVAEFLGA